MHSFQLFFPAPTPPRVLIPLAATKVRAGFPSPATDYIEKLLDLNELLIKRKESTFFMRVGGVSMVEFGINDRDMEFKEDGSELEIWGVVTHVVHSF